MYERRTRYGRAALALALFTAACGEETPPYDALPLRDALRAAPEVIASLPDATRREVAERIEEAARDADERTTAQAPELPTLDTLAAAADEARESEGKDALVLAGLANGEAGLVVASSLHLDFDEAKGAKETGDDGAPVIRGRPGAATAALEKAALEGHAGRELRALAREHHAREIVRTTGLPMGVWLWQETLYVNASWLVALSALEGEKAAPIVPVAPPVGTSEMPRPAPLSVDYNPYHLPDNLAECVTQVQGTCTCALNLTCGHTVTDPTFIDANAECTWVNGDQNNNAPALCVLALMSIDGVRTCVESAGSLCQSWPVTTRDQALGFIQDGPCMTILDQCLATGTFYAPDGPSGCNDCGNCNGCDGCGSGSSGDSCNDDCSKCNENCSECNQNCKDCNQNTKDCNDNCKQSGAGETAAQAGQCSVRRRPGRSPLPSPIGTALWLLAPVVYVLSRKRRRP